MEIMTAFNFESETKVTVVGYKTVHSTGVIGTVESNTARGTAGSVTSVNSFTLSDPDVGDSFDVKVWHFPCSILPSSIYRCSETLCLKRLSFSPKVDEASTNFA
jgi:hypothetical protein